MHGVGGAGGARLCQMVLEVPDGAGGAGTSPTTNLLITSLTMVQFCGIQSHVLPIVRATFVELTRPDI